MTALSLRRQHSSLMSAAAVSTVDTVVMLTADSECPLADDVCDDETAQGYDEWAIKANRSISAAVWTSSISPPTQTWLKIVWSYVERQVNALWSENAGLESDSPNSGHRKVPTYDRQVLPSPPMAAG